jgi:hypothetical protein
MAIAETDILFKLSGGTTNTSPAAALGGAMSTQAGGIIPKTKTFNSIFDDVSGAEAAAGDVNYRGIYVHNNHGTLTLTSAKIWIDTNVGNANDMIDIGLATQGDNGVESTIANEATAPSPTITWSHACTSYATGLSLGDLAAGHYYGIWIRRTVTAGMAADDDENWTLKVQGDTSA